MRMKTIMNCLAISGNPLSSSLQRLDIEICGSKISDIRPTGVEEPKGERLIGDDLLVTAGLINGHTHSHETFTKGRYENLPLELWMNYVRPPDGINYTRRQVYLRTMLGAIEALRTGTTTIVDDLNISPVLIPEHVEAVIEAYEDSGIRALVAPGMFDLPFSKAAPYVDDLFSEELLKSLSSKPKSLPDEVLAWIRPLLASRHPRRDRVSLIISPSAPQRCSKEFLMRLRRLADEFDLPVVIHVQETRLQVVTGDQFYGSTMIEYLDDLEFLRPGVSLIHGVWLNPREIEILAKTGASLQHNPTSNLALGSGLCPVRELLDAGVNVSIGTDACGSSFTISMLKAVNNTALVQKLRTPDYRKWITAEEAWTAATINGARALGLEDKIGTLAPGMSADLLGFRLSSYAFKPLNNALRQLVYAETGTDLDLILVDGEIIMQGGKFERFDEPAILGEVEEEYERLRHQLDQAELGVTPIRDAYASIYERCLAVPIAEDTYPAIFAAPNCGCALPHAPGLRYSRS